MPVELDGTLDETAWQQGIRFEKKNLSFILALDGDNLALAVQSRSPDGAEPVRRAVPRPKNSPAFIDDCVEFRLGERVFFFNARGACWDSENQSRSFQPVSRIAEDKTWTLEWKAPLAELGLTLTDLEKPIPIAVERRWFQGMKKGDEFLIAFDFAYYPSISTLKLKADVAAHPERDKISAATVRVRKKGEKTILAETVLPEFQSFQVNLPEWKIPPLDDGEYELELSLDGVKHDRITRDFARRVFEWEGNSIGKSDRLIPPFTPIQIKKQTVKTLLRSHSLNDLGLWKQVEITDSNGRQKKLLNAPTRLEISVDGKKTPIRSEGVRWTKKTPTRAEGEIRWNAGDPGGIIRFAWDFDGLMVWDLTLFPTEKKIDYLHLTIPMKNSLAPLMHSCADGIRFNYAGYVPKGEGSVWNSQMAQRREIIGDFVPYLWVGAEEPGISLCAENDMGWVHAPGVPCQELVRDGETLNLLCRLIDRPVKIGAQRTIRLAFQATPIKPMPKGWRRMVFGDWRTRKFVPPEDFLNFWGACYYWGAEAPSDYYPRGKDMTYLRKINDFRNGGEKDLEFIQKWIEGYAPQLEGMEESMKKEWMERYRAHVQAGFSVRQFSDICAYSNGRGVRFDTPEGQTFLNEWNVTEFPSRSWPYCGGIFYELDPVESFRDYAAWYFRQMAEAAIDSIYWDDFFFVSNRNTLLSPAVYLADPETGERDGRIQPSMGLFNMREYVRRIGVMYLEMGKTPKNMVHDTNAAINPILSMAQLNYTWEDKPGDADFQDRFSRDYIRAESLGLQQGNVPFNLWLVRGDDPEKLDWADRTGTGVALTHEMRCGGKSYAEIYHILYDFGYGLDSVEVANYWDEDYPVQIEGLDTSSLFLRKGKEWLLLVCDWGEGGNGRAALPSEMLQGISVFNAETGEKLETTTDAKIKFSLKKHDFLLMKGVTE